MGFKKIIRGFQKLSAFSKMPVTLLIRKIYVISKFGFTDQKKIFAIENTTLEVKVGPIWKINNFTKGF